MNEYKSLGKIVDTYEKDRILTITTFQSKLLLNNRVTLLNLHHMATMFSTGKIQDIEKYKPRYKVVDVTDDDVLPILL